MWGKWVEERIAVEPVMAFDANLQRTIRFGPRHAQDHITVIDLPVVERHLRALVNFAVDEFGRAVMQPPYWQP